jgi:hypothetical protein
MIKVDAQDGEAVTGLSGFANRLSHKLVKGGSVGQPCQRVMMRHVRDAPFRVAAFRHVVKNSQHILRRFIPVANGNLLRVDDMYAIVGRDKGVVINDNGLP